MGEYVKDNKNVIFLCLTTQGASFGLFVTSLGCLSNSKDPTPTLLFSAECQICYPNSTKPTNGKTAQINRFGNFAIGNDEIAFKKDFSLTFSNKNAYLGKIDKQALFQIGED